MQNESKQAVKLGIFAALLAVICCVGPLIPILIGLGSASVLFGLDQYKPVFITLGLLVLTGASWYAVRKRNRCCATKDRKKNVQVVLLIFGVGIGSYLILQYGVIPALSQIASNQIESKVNLQTNVKTSELSLRVEGMTCAGCSVGVKEALLNVPGVVSAEVDWQNGYAKVKYNPDNVTPEKILKAPVADQYKLFLVDETKSVQLKNNNQ